MAVAATGNKGKVQTVSPAASPAATPKKETDPALAVFPAKLPQGLKTVSVPGQVENALVAGAGRFLILELRALDKLAVFDVSEGKIAGFVALESRQDIFAAGAEKLIVVNRQSRMAKRYALAGLKLEATQPVPGSVPMMAVAMGAAAQGPMFVACNDAAHHQIFAVDPVTFQLSEYEMAEGAGQKHDHERPQGKPASERLQRRFGARRLARPRPNRRTPRRLHVGKSHGMFEWANHGKLCLPGRLRRPHLYLPRPA